MLRAAVVFSCLILALGHPARAEDSDWSFRVTPYLWGASLQMDAEIGTNPPAESETSLLEILNFAALIAAEATRDSWSVFGEFNYLDLGDEASTPGGRVEYDTRLKGVMTGAAVGYRILGNDRGRLEAFGGLRYWDLEVSLDLPGGDVTRSTAFTDPIVGLRGSYRLSEDWFASGLVETGGFGVGSDHQWEALARIGYQLSDAWALGLGYRHLMLRRDRNDLDIDIAMNGFFLAIDYTW